jgi:hypothetical protein
MKSDDIHNVTEATHIGLQQTSNFKKSGVALSGAFCGKDKNCFSNLFWNISNLGNDHLT